MSKKELPILAVDDEDTILKMYKTILKDKYDILFAKSAAEALEIIHGCDEIPVVITDIAMESAEAGIKLINELETVNPATQIIIISGYHGKKSVALQTAKGNVASLPKPVEVMYLKLALEAAYTRYFDYRLFYGVLNLISDHPNISRLMTF